MTDMTITRKIAAVHGKPKGLGTDLAWSQEDHFARQDQLQHAVASFDALIVLL
jgi:hypothetical protein